MNNEKQQNPQAKIEDLKDDQATQPRELGIEEAEQVKGGIGLLLPAVQKVREAA